jgi:serine/threonine protein kinase
VKSSNVLLDEGLRARVADVGLARAQRGATMTAGVGTLGYMDPGYFETGELGRARQARRAWQARDALGQASC